MRKNYFLLASLGAALLFFACNRDAELPSDKEVAQEIEISVDIDDDTFVSLKQATGVAEAFFGGQTGVKSTGKAKTIVSTETVRDEGNPKCM